MLSKRQKKLNRLKKSGYITAFCLSIFLICFLSFGGSSLVKAATAKCDNCDATGDARAAEKQFMERIKLFKKWFPNQIDEVALAATVIHNGGASAVLTAMYDPNYKKSDDEEKLQGLKDSQGTIVDLAKKSNGAGGATEDSLHSNLDLLTAATLVMLDSSGWTGNYNEEKYKKFLAGDKLVGNGFNDDNNEIGGAFNQAFCFLGSGFDLLAMPFLGMNNQSATETNRANEIRARTMDSVCKNGYIGAVYEEVQTIKDPTEKQKKKEAIANNIIKLAEDYRKIFIGDDECAVNSITDIGEYSNWKQTDSKWGSLSLGGGGSMANIGCLATSVAIQIARSGTQIINLPSGHSAFNPGAFVTVLNNNGGFDGGGAFNWTGWSSIAPNWKAGNTSYVNISDTKTLANKLSEELKKPAQGSYQKFIVVQISHNGSSQHWVAINNVSDDQVTIYDPSSGVSGNTLDANYSGWTVHSYRVMYATDVPFGQTTPAKENFSGTQLDYKSASYQERLKSLSDYEQCGSKLKDMPLGNSNVCTSGCMVASLAAIQHMYTGETVDVQKLITDMMQEGEWSNDKAGMGTPYFDNSSSSPLLTKNWGLSGQTLYNTDKNTTKDLVITNLKKGKKILLNLGGAQTTYSTTGGHFLMLDHYNEDTHQIYIFNPAGSGTGYITEEQLMSEVLAYSKYGPWAINSSKSSNIDACNTGTASIDKLLDMVFRLEGYGTCNYRGQGDGTGYSASYDSADQQNVGFTTGYGLTYENYKDMAFSIGYTDFRKDGESGCTSKEYIDQMAKQSLSERVETVRSYYEEKSGGKTLEEYQYHALALINHHWPVGSLKLITDIANVDTKSYTIYSKFLEYNGLNGMQGGLNRREVEYHLWYNGNYNAERKSDVVNTEAYWKKLIEEYQKEQVN